MTDVRLVLVDPETCEPVQEGEPGDLALLIDGDFKVSYQVKYLPANLGIMNNLLNDAYEYGKQARSKELLKILGGRS